MAQPTTQSTGASAGVEMFRLPALPYRDETGGSRGAITISYRIQWELEELNLSSATSLVS